MKKIVYVQFISKQVKHRGTMVKKEEKPPYWNGRFPKGDPKGTLKIENVVASTGIDQELNLEALAADLPGTEYDPDRFPGLVYRLQDPKVVVLLFGSGKVVITGGKKPENAEEAIDKIVSKLTEYALLG